MDDRVERVKIAHTYFLEYLRLMNHYELLEKPTQVKAFKMLYKTHQDRQKKGNDEDEDMEQVDTGKSAQQNHPMMALAKQMEDRDAKIAAFKLKKAIEGNLERLKNYQDEET